MDPHTGLLWLLQLSLALATEVSEDPSQTTQVTTGVPEYPYPRIVILGQSGVGKSSVANVLAGCEPNDEECFFPVCSGSNSCTKNTSIAPVDHFMGDWTVETYGMVTLVDTPGFGDSTGDDGPLLTDMIKVLKNILGQANLIMLCTEGGRFSPSTIKMLLELESMFGRDRLWGNVMIEVTKWAYDVKAIADRDRNKINETTTCKDINDSIMDITHLDHPLDCIFLDSWAVYYPEDESQQRYMNIYAAQLWETANSMPTFDFFTIEDILEQLDDCRDEAEWLNDVIKNNISELTELISANSDQISSNFENIESNMEDISSNSQNIGINCDQIASNFENIEINKKNISRHSQNIGINSDQISSNFEKIETNMEDISSNSQNIGINSDQIATNLENIESNLEDISSNSQNIGKNSMAINSINDAPIGTVMAWLGGKTSGLPDGWMKCDGSPILEGPLKGLNTPSLNAEGRFLRGGSVADSWTEQDHMVQDHKHGVSDTGHKHEDTGHQHTYMFPSIAGDHELSNIDHGLPYLSTDFTPYLTKSTTTSKANIASSHTGISVTEATGPNIGLETRPKNIVVEWIIKVI